MALSLLHGASAGQARGRDDTADVSLSVKYADPQVTFKTPVVPVMVTFTVTNNGPSLANYTYVAITAKPEIRMSVTASIEDVHCKPEAPAKSRTPTCTDLPPVAVGGSYDVVVSAYPVRTGKITVSASVHGYEPDPNLANNGATATVPVLAQDSEAPTMVELNPLDRIQKNPIFPVSWTGRDPQTGIQSFSVRYRAAPSSGTFGPPTAWLETPDQQATFTPMPGVTYCFSVSATDRAGNTSPWSQEKCTAQPFSVRSFRRSAGWTLVPGDAFLYGAALRSATKDSTLSLDRISGRQVALVATVCPKCGAINVRWQGRQIARVSLVSSTTKRREKIYIFKRRQVQEGALVLKVASGRVEIEGIGVSRV
jgi:hypothetical protein